MLRLTMNMNYSPHKNSNKFSHSSKQTRVLWRHKKQAKRSQPQIIKSTRGKIQAFLTKTPPILIALTRRTDVTITTVTARIHEAAIVLFVPRKAKVSAPFILTMKLIVVPKKENKTMMRRGLRRSQSRCLLWLVTYRRR